MKKYLIRFAAPLLALVLLTAPASALTVPQALELLEENYYYGVPDAAYGAATLDELLEMLGDPYTDYMTAEEYQDFLDYVEQEVNTVGIGVTIRYTREGMLVERLVDGGPAQEAGLRSGDLIIEVEGISCVPADESHRELVVGEEGTQVALTVLRDGQLRHFTAARRTVKVPNTQFIVLEGGVGYVDCNSFGTDTGNLFADGLKQYDSQVDCWLVDLRGNAGGYTNSALDVMSSLNGPGRYVYLEDGNGEVGGYAGYDARLTRKPLIVLVDGGSASASELLASGVRDTERGILVGSRTYGKGVAQIVLDSSSLPAYFDGDCLKITAHRFYGAGGGTTDRIGVIPTLLVDDGYTYAVAEALTGGSEETSSLCVMPGIEPFYIDPEADEEVIAALLSALSPQMEVFYSGGVFNPCTPAQAAEKLGLDYDNRWFNDVADSPYANAINAMGTYKLLGGTGNGNFSPKKQLTRGQLCVMLARALNVTAGSLDHFTDVPADSWYADGVNAIAELGLVNGVGSGKFDPDAVVTQEEFLAILGRTARYINFALDQYGAELDTGEAPQSYGIQLALAPYSDWAKSSVAVLAWGLENAAGSRGDLLYARLTQLTPTAPVLREEAAAGMYKLLAGLEILP